MSNSPLNTPSSLNYTDFLEAHGKSETTTKIGVQECMRGLRNGHGPQTTYFDERGVGINRDDFEMKYANWAQGFLMTTNRNIEGFIIKACTLGESIGILGRFRDLIISLVGTK